MDIVAYTWGRIKDVGDTHCTAFLMGILGGMILSLAAFVMATVLLFVRG